MGNFKRISECGDPSEVLNAPMEISLIPTPTFWAGEWDHLWDRKVSKGDTLQITLITDPRNTDVQAGDYKNASPLPWVFQTFHWPVESCLSRIMRSISLEGQTSREVTSQMQAKLNELHKGRYDVRIRRKEGTGKLSEDDSLHINILAKPDSADQASDDRGVSDRGIAGDYVLSVGFASAMSRVECEGQFPADIAEDIAARIRNFGHEETGVHVTNLSDVGDEKLLRNHSSEQFAEIEAELFDRYVAALRWLSPENRHSISIETADCLLGDSGLPKAIIGKCIAEVFPGLRVSRAIREYEESVIKPLISSKNARSRHDLIRMALHAGYRPPAQPSELMKKGAGQTIPSVITKPVAEKVLSGETTTPAIEKSFENPRRPGANDTKREQPIHYRETADASRIMSGERVKVPRDKIRTYADDVSKRTLTRWSPLIFYACADDTDQELRLSSECLEAGISPARYPYGLLIRAADSAFHRAYELVVVKERIDPILEDHW